MNTNTNTSINDIIHEVGQEENSKSNEVGLTLLFRIALQIFLFSAFIINATKFEATFKNENLTHFQEFQKYITAIASFEFIIPCFSIMFNGSECCGLPRNGPSYLHFPLCALIQDGLFTLISGISFIYYVSYFSYFENFPNSFIKIVWTVILLEIILFWYIDTYHFKGHFFLIQRNRTSQQNLDPIEIVTRA